MTSTVLRERLPLLMVERVSDLESGGLDQNLGLIAVKLKSPVFVDSSTQTLALPLLMAWSGAVRRSIFRALVSSSHEGASPF